MPKKTGQLNVRIAPELVAVLEEIEEKHRIGQAEMVRGLVEAAVAYFQEHGWFGFPVDITPQADVLRAIRKITKEPLPDQGKRKAS